MNTQFRQRTPLMSYHPHCIHHGRCSANQTVGCCCCAPQIARSGDCSIRVGFANIKMRRGSKDTSATACSTHVSRSSQLEKCAWDRVTSWRFAAHRIEPAKKIHHNFESDISRSPLHSPVRSASKPRKREEKECCQAHKKVLILEKRDTSM